MHVSQLKESKFLKKEDVGTGVVGTIREITQENVAKQGAEPEMKFCLHFDEWDKPLVLNSVNGQLIAQIVGSEETDHWMGSQVELYEDPSIMFAGKLVGGIRVRAPGSRVQQAPRAPRAPVRNPPQYQQPPQAPPARPKPFGTPAQTAPQAPNVPQDDPADDVPY